MLFKNILLSFMFIGALASAQEVDYSFLNEMKQKGRFGGSMGFNYRELDYKLSDDAKLENTRNYRSPPGLPGFQTGILYVQHINEKISFRAETIFSFYTPQAHSQKNMQHKKPLYCAVELPGYVLFSPFRNKKAPYFIAGTKVAFSTTNVDLDGDIHLPLKRKDISVDAGIGFHINFLFFRIMPELRISHGLVNLLFDENDMIASVSQNSISLVINSY
ncbi:MAG: hypothetical protein COA57_07570 [Flavobacteriales bacterium]|nr:MAG: hypothetical protein COA57_07570 [Flavobacteriales bacterium]